MEEIIFSDLINFIHEQSRSFDVPVTMETSLENDLGITGEDGEELIVAFGEKYKVDISNFNFTNYFYPEPSIASAELKAIKLLTVGHLMKAIRVGRLDDNVIDNWS